MAVVANHYVQQQSHLGILESGLRSLKSSKRLMNNSVFVDMYGAVEKHHRELKLAHLTGKSKDLMEQAEKDTKFYDILIKMLCEVNRLPRQKQKDSLKKVHTWYTGNMHTLQTGPRFGKLTLKMESRDKLKLGNQSDRSTPSTSREKSARFDASDSKNKGQRQGKKPVDKSKSDFKKFIGDARDEGNVSTPRGVPEGTNLPSEPALSRMSMSGTDFMTSRFFSDLPVGGSKLSWSIDTPIGKSPFAEMMTPTAEWEEPDMEVHQLAEGSLGIPDFPSRLSAPVSSPGHFHNDLDSDVGSVNSDNSGGSGISSPAGQGSEMMDFSDVRRRLSRPQTSSGSLKAGMTEEGMSSAEYGLPRKMVHSVASLVNPHAKLAETEAKKAEQEYYRLQQNELKIRLSQSGTTRINPPNSSRGMDRNNSTIDEQTVVLRPVTVSGGKGENWKSFMQDHLYGQDILSKLNFVGRSGTALDVRYSAHHLGDMPEQHTGQVVNLYTKYSEESRGKENKVDDDINLHTQSLEDFYQATDKIFPSPPAKFIGRNARATSAKSTSRGKSAKSNKTACDQKSSAVRFQKSSPQGKTAQEKKTEEEARRPGSHHRGADIKLDAVVNMIDMVKDEMNFFREKLAPTPMSGFRHPASEEVPTQPLSRPVSGHTRQSPTPAHRSPSPVQRTNTPTQDVGSLMMGEPEVPGDTYKPAPLQPRPHSATVYGAVDWRGKIAPSSAKNKWSKNRFGGHTYVQKSKPSLRTAGRVTGNTRPKTAPVSTQERWRVKEKESDKNTRIAQAASNTVKEVNQRDVDSMMTISHILGTSDSRYGSYGSLFLDEDFLRSVNSRYSSSSVTGLPQGSQNREYLSIVGSLPKTPATGDSRSPTGSRQHSSKKRAEPGYIDKIPEEQPVREDVDAEDGEDEEDEVVDVSPLQPELTQGRPPLVPRLPLGESDSEVTSSVPLESQRATAHTGLSNQEASQSALPNQDTPKSELTNQETPQAKLTNQETHPADLSNQEQPEADQSKTKELRETIQVSREDRSDDVHIEVTAVPALGRPHTAPGGRDYTVPASKLDKSDAWHYTPDVEIQNVNSQEYLDRVTLEEIRQRGRHVEHQHQSHEHWSKNIVRPENYCFACMPDSMTTKVGRSAGRMPGGSQSPSGQVLRMARRQNEHLKKTPPLRTPPSIPSPHHPLGGRSPRTGQAYSSELEHHARKVKSPRHFMEQGKHTGKRRMVELRKDNCRSAPPGSQMDDDCDMGSSLNVISLRVPGRAHTAPTTHHHSYDSQEQLSVLQPFPEEAPGEEEETVTPKKVPVRHPTSPPSASNGQSIAHIGRPIAQVSHIPDPDEVEEAVLKQKQAKAAVDIQRIFRGYVARNVYKELLWDERVKAEDKQVEVQEQQKSFRKHLGRKAKIYSRPPINPETLKWAKEFKAIQTQKAGQRQGKKEALARELTSHQLKAASKISVIGPHVEIYDIYHPKETGPSKREMYNAAVMIQKTIRGYLIRKIFERLKRKAVFCGTTWKKIVRDYKSLLVRVQRWRGVDKPKTPFTLQEMYEYMDSRRRYESIFDKKQFGGELELSELDSYFRECDLFPSQAEIDEGIDVTLQGRPLKKGQGLEKSQVLNLLFYIYVPTATQLKNTRQSTWMNPIIDGMEARKLLGSEFTEAVPLSKCADLVIASKRERREKEQAERNKQLKKEAEDESEDEDDDETDVKKSRHGSRKVSIVRKK